MAENLQIRLADPKEADRLAEIEAICFPPAEAASHEDVVNRMGAFPENFVVAVKDRIRTERDPRIPSSGNRRRTCGILQEPCERAWKKSPDPYL